MVIENSVKVRNYKCFGEEIMGFERIMPINIIIGKNNSGKSSLIDLVQYIINGDDAFMKNSKGNLNTEVIINHILTEADIASVFSTGQRTHAFNRNNDFEYGKHFIGCIYTYSISIGGEKKFLGLNERYDDAAISHFRNLLRNIKMIFANKAICNITAERDIVPENDNTPMTLSSNGVGATILVQRIINWTEYDRDLIEKELLTELNKIVNPDIEFERILVQFNEGKWEIYFEDKKGTKIALSKMGSGIKTVLLVLLNLLVRPIIEKKHVKEYVFAFEELENNLHPSLQRRLYSYLIDFSRNNNAYLFLTTHSNIVIDSFGAYEKAQLIHVVNDGTKSTTTTVLGYKQNKHILKDLDVRASDLLQSNGIIWVEGPSDRNYLNKWMEILAPNLKEGLHYSIMFYGGRLLANLTLDYEWFDKEIIPLLKINTNAYVIMDRDGKTVNAQLNQTKIRIEQEIGEKHCWITKGREIENYLNDDVIKGWLETKSIIGDFRNIENEKLENNIIQIDQGDKVKYNLNKTSNSSEIVRFINEDSINVLDLKVKLQGLIKIIKEWNSIYG